MKIAIIGTAISSIHDAKKLDRNEWKLWSMNGSWEVYSDADLHFQFHTPVQLVQDGNKPEYFDYLKKKRGAVVVGHADSSYWPEATLFPWDEFFKGVHRDYFNNSIAYMIVFAMMHEGVEEIAIYGVDMSMSDGSLNEEYTHQRRCVEYWIGVAEGRGIKVTIPEGSQLVKTGYRYGLEAPNETVAYVSKQYEIAKSRHAFVEKERQELENAMKGKLHEGWYHKGSMDALNNIMRTLDYNTPAMQRQINGEIRPKSGGNS